MDTAQQADDDGKRRANSVPTTAEGGKAPAPVMARASLPDGHMRGMRHGAREPFVEEPLPDHLSRRHSAARLARRAEHLLEERLDDLENDALAHPPKKPMSPLRAFAQNIWVLLIISGVLAVILVAKSRLHVYEPLQYVHASDPSIPYVEPLPNTYIDYLYVVNVIAPYYPPGSSSSGGHRRRRSLLSSQPASSHISSHVSSDAAAGQRAELSRRLRLGSQEAADGQLAAHIRSLLSHPKRVMSRRLQATETVNTTDIYLPNLIVAVAQKDASAPPPEPVPSGTLATPADYGYTVVSTEKLCTTKLGTAVKCNLDFTSADMNAAYVEGEPLYLVFYEDNLAAGQIIFRSHSSEIGWLGYAKNWIALAILVGMLVGIASERVHRMWCAFIAAAFMMGLLLWMNMAPDLETCMYFLDESTLGLLFGMMIIVGRLKDTGLFEILSAGCMRMCGGRMWLLALLMMWITGFVSALLDNVTTVLLMGPITISMMQTCNIDPRPLLMAQVLMSNIGGAATMVGDPPNIIIGTALSQYIGFVDFIIYMAPGAIMAAIPASGLILWLYRSTLMPRIEGYQKVLDVVSGYGITDWDLFAKCIYVTGVVVLGFLLHPLHHLDPAWFALLGAVVLCVATNPMDVEEVLENVEWDMLLFFAGQFIMVESAAEVGMIDMIGGWLEYIIRAAPPESRTIVAIEILLWASAIISGILDNIPYTITMVPVIEYLAAAGLGLDIKILAWALAFGACFGGNATLIGASANIVAATIMDRSGFNMTFLRWMKVGIPVTILTVAVANVWLLLRFCLP